MNVSSAAGTGNGSASLEPVEPRLEAFSRFLAAVDRADWKAGLLATRELRKLGISVVLLPPQGGKAGGR